MSRSLPGAVSALLLLSGLALLALGLIGLWCVLGLPVPPNFASANLGAGIPGLVLVMGCGVPGLVLASAGALLRGRGR